MNNRYQDLNAQTTCLPRGWQDKDSLRTAVLMGLKKLHICLIVITCLIASGCGHTKEQLYYAASISLPGIADEMNTAGFWIGRHPSPDKEILSPDEITALNADIEDNLKLTHRVINIAPVYSGGIFRKDLKASISSLAGQGLYCGDGRKAGQKFYRDIEKTIGSEEIPENINVGYGFIIHNTNERIIPTDEGLYSKPGDIDFDEVQNSALDIGAAVAILHNSADGLWAYVIGDSSGGWVKRDMIAVASIDAVKKRQDDSSRKVVVAARKADIFLNECLTKYYDHGRMGTCFNSSGRETKDAYEIILPTKGDKGELALIKGYIRKKDVELGYLPYTPRTIIDQAFKLLSAPYGWGDKRGEQDCSRFIQEIFATVGILMPRNSGPQGKVGRLIGEYEPGEKTDEKRRALLKDGIGGITIIQLKGHIMLYFGDIDGVPYVIHSAWAYREPGLLKDRVRVIGRVAVTDISLGEGSRKGSLLERVVMIRNIDKNR